MKLLKNTVRCYPLCTVGLSTGGYLDLYAKDLGILISFNLGKHVKLNFHKIRNKDKLLMRLNRFRLSRVTRTNKEYTPKGIFFEIENEKLIELIDSRVYETKS